MVWLVFWLVDDGDGHNEPKEEHVWYVSHCGQNVIILLINKIYKTILTRINSNVFVPLKTILFFQFVSSSIIIMINFDLMN